MRAEALQERLAIVSKAVVSAAASDGENEPHADGFRPSWFACAKLLPRKPLRTLECKLTEIPVISYWYQVHPSRENSKNSGGAAQGHFSFCGTRTPHERLWMQGGHLYQRIKADAFVFGGKGFFQRHFSGLCVRGMLQ